MPIVAFKRQTVAVGTCPVGYNFYNCNTADVVWSGCCSIDPCSTGDDCDEDNQPPDAGDDDDDAAVVVVPTTAPPAAVPPTTVTATVANAPTGVVNAVNPVTTTVNGNSQSSAIGPSDTAGGTQPTVPLSEDPSTETVAENPRTVQDVTSSAQQSRDDVPAIIGVTIGAVVLVAIISILFFCYRRRSRAKQRRKYEAQPFVAEKRGAGNIVPPDSPELEDASGGMHMKLASNDPVPVLDSKPVSNQHELPAAIPPAYAANPTYELPSNTVPQQRGSIGTVSTLHDAQGSIPSQSQTPTSRFTRKPVGEQAARRESQGVSTMGSDTPNVISPVSPQLVSPAEVEGSTPNRVSRATGATYTPASGATASPTINMSPSPTP